MAPLEPQPSVVQVAPPHCTEAGRCPEIKHKFSFLHKPCNNRIPELPDAGDAAQPAELLRSCFSVCVSRMFAAI